MDGSGLASEETDLSAFTRASQLYFRGNLSRARDAFNVIIYRFADSPLAGDAGLAVRRIEQDLGADAADAGDGNGSAGSPAVAVVGLPSNTARVARVAAALTASGWTATVVHDAGAPDITVVLFPEGMQDGARTVGDSLDSWLVTPDPVPVQPGGQIMGTIVPGHEGILVVVGADAQTAAGIPQ